jgi:hypothetical protein
MKVEQEEVGIVSLDPGQRLARIGRSRGRSVAGPGEEAYEQVNVGGLVVDDEDSGIALDRVHPRRLSAAGRPSSLVHHRYPDVCIVS